jgi:serine/threonine protein kinase
VVWLARSHRDETLGALKVLHRQRAKDPIVSELFEQEATLTRSLRHPNIVAVIGEGRIDADAARLGAGRFVAGSPYLVTEYCGGGDARSRIGHLTYPEVRHVLRSVLAGLEHMHSRGVVHFDIKPSNILFTSDGSGRVLLADLGMACRVTDLAARLVGDMVLGSPPYMAPEQIRNDPGAQGPWTDLYGLGAAAWVLVTGKRAHNGTLMQTFAQHLAGRLPPFLPLMPLPSGFERWVRTMLAGAPRDRFGDARSALEALNGLGYSALRPPHTEGPLVA